jgi:predicted  nucleic acid-binding Zn-ribbon protein
MEAEERKEKATMKSEQQPLILWIAMGALLAINLALGIVAARQNLRINELSAKLDTTIAAQGETVQKLSQTVEVATAELHGNVQQAANRIAKTEAEFQRTQQSLSAQAKQRKETEEKLASQLGELREVQTATQGTLGSLSTDFSGVKQEVSLTKEEISTARTELQRELQRMIGDMGVQSDLIAHNSTELAELKQLGAREYIEFDLRRAKNPARFGPMSLHLRKTDVKRQKYTLHLIADDRTIEKKDKTANEPVQFYQDGYRQPTEIVVNQVYKDRIVGYVSVPKQREDRGAQSAANSLPSL